MLMLDKCYDNKMVKLPGGSFVGAFSCSKHTKKANNLFYTIQNLNTELFELPLDLSPPPCTKNNLYPISPVEVQQI